MREAVDGERRVPSGDEEVVEALVPEEAARKERARRHLNIYTESTINGRSGEIQLCTINDGAEVEETRLRVAQHSATKKGGESLLEAKEVGQSQTSKHGSTCVPI
jgi:hypothetical protein